MWGLNRMREKIAANYLPGMVEKEISLNENKKEKTTFYTLQLSTYDLKNKIWKVKLSVNYNKKILNCYKKRSLI